MRRRITFVHGAEDAFDPQQLKLENNTLRITSLKAAREDRCTFGLDELPQEVWRALKQCYELHIRWVSPKSYPSVEPFISRASPGLHVFYTPQKNRSAFLLCPLVKKVFGEHLKCVTAEETFAGLPVLSERFASSAAFQYYQVLSSIKDFTTYVQQKGCSPSDDYCRDQVGALTLADYIDIDYDTISQALVVNAFRHGEQHSGAWNEKIENSEKIARIEVGVLAKEASTEPEELSFGGFLTVLGEDEKPSPTLFSFPSRHHLAPTTSLSKYYASFLSPTGLHPTLRLSFASQSVTPPSDTCSLHIYLALPSTLFVDKYQLSSPLFLSSKNLRSVRSLSGETDLEAPEWVIQKWGSAMLVELAPPTSANTPKPPQWHADIPLHLRYLPPTSGGNSTLDVPWPVVFWACTAEEGTKMNVNPFDRVNMGYDGLFGPRTMFYHLEPDVQSVDDHALISSLQVPVLDQDKMSFVQAGTVGVVLLAALWLLFKIGLVVRESRLLLGKAETGGKKSQ